MNKTDSFQEQKWISACKLLVDILALQVSLYLGWSIRSYLTRWWPLEMSSQTYFDLSLGLAIVPFGYWLVRLYPGYGLTTVERLRRRVRSTFVFFLTFVSYDYLIQNGGRSRGILLVVFLLSMIIPPILQTILRSYLIKADLWGMPVLVFGAGKTGTHVVSSLIKDPVLGLKPVAILDDDPYKKNTYISGVPVVGDISHASRFVGRINCVLIAIPGAGREFIVKLSQCLPFWSIVIIPDLFGIQSLWVEARDLGGVVGLEIQKNLLKRRNVYIKQIMDYALGIPLFFISIPMLAFFSIWIILCSPDNPFYCQVREGKGGHKFKLWKLRTMHPHAEKLLHEYLDSNPEAKNEWNNHFKLKDDPRIIKGIGWLLRKSSLDELPQLWNVLQGNMSLVGPRPFPHYHLERFDNDFRVLRRSVLPGMTGLWQVSSRSDGDLVTQESLDTYYIRNWSIWMDIILLGRTFLVVLTGKGAY